jgi:F0F1-type ATP synthase assembly protein I
MIRDSIVQNKTAPETAKIILAGSEKKTKKENPYVMLQAGLTLLGLALGYLLTVLLGIKQNDFGFWVMLIAGMGLGMILTFCIKLKLEEKKREKNLDNKE